MLMFIICIFSIIKSLTICVIYISLQILTKAMECHSEYKTLQIKAQHNILMTEYY